MSHFDVFNGDADGLCALQQLRLAEPREAVLVTGVKRDIALLARVPAQQGDTVTVLDVSMARNREALEGLLARGVRVEWFDHHFAGEPLVHPGLRAVLDAAPGVCTSLLVDRHLRGAHRAWAVVGAYGDNMAPAAQALAGAMSPDERERLRTLGEAINYNAYGETEADLLLPPARLRELLRPYSNPDDFLASEAVAQALVARQQADMDLASSVKPARVLQGGTLYLLPDAAWSRRVQGVFANALARAERGRAHAVLCPIGIAAFKVSVRAPLQTPQGADALCRGFATGGGRAAAAGIDVLPRELLDKFVRAFERAYPGLQS